MTTHKTSGVSLAALDARKASEEAHEFEYTLSDGTKTGIFLSVLGTHSHAVTAKTNEMINERRRVEAAREAQAVMDRTLDTFTPFETEVEFSQRLAAVRIVGWRGIDEDFTPDLALKLCQINPDVAAQVMARSNNLGNFMKGLRRAS